MGGYYICNPFSNTYNNNSRNHSNLKWSNNFSLNLTQGAPPKYSKFPAKEALSTWRDDRPAHDDEPKMFARV